MMDMPTRPIDSTAMSKSELMSLSFIETTLWMNSFEKLHEKVILFILISHHLHYHGTNARVTMSSLLLKSFARCGMNFYHVESSSFIACDSSNIAALET